MQGLFGNDTMSGKSHRTGGQEACTLALALSLTVNGTLVIQSTSLDLTFLLYQPRVLDKMTSHLVLGLTVSSSMEEPLYFFQDRQMSLLKNKESCKRFVLRKTLKLESNSLLPKKEKRKKEHKTKHLIHIHTHTQRRQDKGNSLPLRRL